MVNQSNIFKKIGYILNELQDQYQFLSENPDQLSELELELFLANANFLSDHVQIVKKLNGNAPLKELPQAARNEAVQNEVTQHQVDEEPESELMLPQISNSQPESKIETEDYFKIDDEPSTFEFVINENSSPVPANLDEVIEDNHHEEMVDYNDESEEDELISPEVEEFGLPVEDENEDEVGPEPFLVSKESSESDRVLVQDKLEDQEIPKPSTYLIPDVVEEKVVQPVDTLAKPTLNDLLANRNSGNLNDASASPVITDLKKAVNLNEKLLYIKDLFNGYNLAYSEAIDILNKLSDFKSADNFLKNNYAVKNNWEAKQATVDKFYELLRQRFPEG